MSFSVFLCRCLWISQHKLPVPLSVSFSTYMSVLMYVERQRYHFFYSFFNRYFLIIFLYSNVALYWESSGIIWHQQGMQQLYVCECVWRMSIHMECWNVNHLNMINLTNERKAIYDWFYLLWSHNWICLPYIMLYGYGCTVHYYYYYWCYYFPLTRGFVGLLLGKIA